MQHVNIVLSGSSIVRQMSDKWNIGQMRSWTTDMEPILIPAHKERDIFV